MAHPYAPVSVKESPEYYILVEDSSTQTTQRDFFILGHIRDTATQTAEEEFISQKTTQETSTQTPEDDLVFPEQPPVTLETCEESRKRKISNEQELTDESEDCKLQKIETCSMGDEFDSSFSKKGRRNPDIISAPSHGLFESSRLDNIDQENLNLEESHSQNQELNVPGYSGKTKNLKKEENITLKKNICQKEKAPSEKSDIDVSEVRNLSSGEDIIPVPGSSQGLENDSHSKEFVENSKNRCLPKQPAVKSEQIHPQCVYCERSISKHVVEVHDGKNLYRCCRCLFESDNFNQLQIHVYNEHKHYFCNMCNLKHLIMGSSVSDQRCSICNLNFECEYQFREHNISQHKNYFKKHCRICNKNLDEHFVRSRGIKYQCCVRECKNMYKRTSNLNKHLSTHYALTLSKCEICGCHTKQLNCHKQNVHSFCKSCGKWFVNIFFLNEHHCEELFAFLMPQH